MADIEMIEEKDFQEKVINAKNAVIVTFVKSGCATCGNMKKVLARSAKDVTGITFYTMDAEGCPQRVKDYRIQRYPAHIMYKDQYPVRAKLGFANGMLFRRWALGHW